MAKAIFLENMELLHFEEWIEKRKIAFCLNESSFDQVNYKGMQYVMYFLMGFLRDKSGKIYQDSFKICWPVYSKKDETIFRQMCLNILKELKSADELASKLVAFAAGTIVTPVGPKLYRLLSGLSSYVLAVRANIDGTLLVSSNPATKKPTRNSLLEHLRLKNDQYLTGIAKYEHDFSIEKEEFAAALKQIQRKKFKFECDFAETLSECDALYETLKPNLSRFVKDLPNSNGLDFYSMLVERLDSVLEKHQTNVRKIDSLCKKCILINKQLDSLLDDDSSVSITFDEQTEELSNEPDCDDTKVNKGTCSLERLFIYWAKLLEKINNMLEKTIDKSALDSLHNVVNSNHTFVSTMLKDLDKNGVKVTEELSKSIKCKIDSLRNKCKSASGKISNLPESTLRSSDELKFTLNLEENAKYLLEKRFLHTSGNTSGILDISTFNLSNESFLMPVMEGTE